MWRGLVLVVSVALIEVVGVAGQTQGCAVPDGMSKAQNYLV